MDIAESASSPQPVRVLDYGTQNRLAGWRRVASLLVGLMFVAAGGALLGGMIGRLLPQYVSARGAIYVVPTIVPPQGMGGRSSLLLATTELIESPSFVSSSIAPLIANGTITPSDVQSAIIRADVNRKSNGIQITVTHRKPAVVSAIEAALAESISRPGALQAVNLRVAILQHWGVSIADRSTRLILACRVAGALLCALVVLLLWFRFQRRATPAARR